MFKERISQKIYLKDILHFDAYLDLYICNSIV